MSRVDEWKTLLIGNNSLSLRTAVVLEDRGLVSLVLIPQWCESSISMDIDWRKSEHTWLYRRRRSFFGELALRRGFFPVEQNVKPLSLERPELELLWANSGQSVAVLLNHEPWAFIHEGGNHGYSKGILRPTIGNLWDQILFEDTFEAEK